MKLTYYIPIYKWGGNPNSVDGNKSGLTAHRTLDDLYMVEGDVAGYFTVEGEMPTRAQFEHAESLPACSRPKEPEPTPQKEERPAPIGVFSIKACINIPYSEIKRQALEAARSEHRGYHHDEISTSLKEIKIKKQYKLYIFEIIEEY
jgi:hypothetical protein